MWLFIRMILFLTPNKTSVFFFFFFVVMMMCCSSSSKIIIIIIIIPLFSFPLFLIWFLLGPQSAAEVAVEHLRRGSNISSLREEEEAAAVIVY